jgi:hypothetical protein
MEVKKNDMAVRPLNAGQRVAARGVLDYILGDGRDVQSWLSGPLNQSLAGGDITPLQWWGGFKKWHQRPLRADDPHAEVRRDIEWACARALMCVIGVSGLSGLGIVDYTESDKWLDIAYKLAKELREREEGRGGKSTWPAERLALAERQLDAARRTIAILNEFEDEGGDFAIYRNLQCEVLAAVKIIYRVED